MKKTKAFCLFIVSVLFLFYPDQNSNTLSFLWRIKKKKNGRIVSTCAPIHLATHAFRPQHKKTENYSKNVEKKIHFIAVTNAKGKQYTYFQYDIVGFHYNVYATQNRTTTKIEQ